MSRKNQSRVHIGIAYHHIISQSYRLLRSSNFTPVHVICFPSLVQTLVWVGEWCILDLCGAHCWGFVADSLALLRRFGVLVGRKDARWSFIWVSRVGHVFLCVQGSNAISPAMEVSWNVTFLKSGHFFGEVSKAFQKMPWTNATRCRNKAYHWGCGMISKATMWGPPVMFVGL